MDYLYSNAETLDDLYTEMGELTSSTMVVLMKLQVTDDVKQSIANTGYSMDTRTMTVPVVSYAGQQTTVVTTTERTYPTVVVIREQS